VNEQDRVGLSLYVVLWILFKSRRHSEEDVENYFR